jgi:hypothetical protein
MLLKQACGYQAMLETPLFIETLTGRYWPKAAVR